MTELRTRPLTVAEIDAGDVVPRRRSRAAQPRCATRAAQQQLHTAGTYGPGLRRHISPETALISHARGRALERSRLESKLLTKQARQRMS